MMLSTLGTTAGAFSEQPLWPPRSQDKPLHAVTFFHLTPHNLAFSSTTAMMLNIVDATPVTSRTGAGQDQEQAQIVESRLQQDSALTEMRRLSGLTWEQVATLFKVTARAVHHWASGKQMAAKHSEHLQRILGCLRQIDRGSPLANYRAVMAPAENGMLALDLLTAHRYRDFVLALGVAADGVRTDLSQPTVRPDRLPVPLEALMGSLETSVHTDQGPRRKPPRIVRAAHVR